MYLPELDVNLKTKIIQIGNSQGIRLAKPILEQAGITDDVELRVKGGQIIIQAANRQRLGWEILFKAMAQRGDNAMLDPDTKTDWDETEWSWE
ncbi:MAG: AbrB/MazE/SpoVT family DNA-binding domain-containing protein [Bacteroidetes bacterium]|nr:AbrB/MazE/SpoVT family DNA-binding domain-containing protein [Bacteroidota bacterium]